MPSGWRILKNRQAAAMFSAHRFYFLFEEKKIHLRSRIRQQELQR